MSITLAALPKKQTKDTVKIERIIVTPDMAAQWLEETNTHNRVVAQWQITKYASDMKHGRWKFTGDAIRFDASRRLLDGQHRLMACKRAGTPFETYVMYGLPSEVQDVMDTGKARKASDVISLRGITNSNKVSATVRQLIAYKKSMSAQTSAATTSEIVETLEQHPNITKSVGACYGIMRSMPHASIAFLHYVGTMFLDQTDAADAMAQVIKTGVPSYDGDAFHAFREKMLAVTSTSRMAPHVVRNGTFLAWNHFVQQKPLPRFVFVSEHVDIDGLDRSVL